MCRLLHLLVTRLSSWETIGHNLCLCWSLIAYKWGRLSRSCRSWLSDLWYLAWLFHCCILNHLLLDSWCPEIYLLISWVHLLYNLSLDLLSIHKRLANGKVSDDGTLINLHGTLNSIKG